MRPTPGSPRGELDDVVRAAGVDQVLVVERVDGSSEVTVGGAVQVLDAVPGVAVQEVLTTLVAERAAALGRPVRVLTRSSAGETVVVVHPSGAVHPHEANDEPFDADAEERPGQPEHAEQLEQRADVAPGRRSFLREPQAELAATTGWRGALNRLGLRLPPDDAERAARADAMTVAQHWAGPRTIAVVNAKGGAGKTPTTAMLSAAFARYGGGGVLAWENHQTRGTLGWRTESGAHEATALDLLPRVRELLGPGARVADLARYVHHQRSDRYDVLRSRPLALASGQRVTPADVDALHELACTYYRMVLIDSGNDESDPAWLRMVQHADQVVVPTTTRDDHAEAGALLLEALATRDERSARLAASAVVVVTQADPRATTSDVQRVVEGFSPLARAVVTVPFDRSLVDGQLRYDAQRAATRRAWLAAAAAVARGL